MSTDPAHQHAEPPEPDGPVRVLVVDGDEAFTDLVTIALRYEGWEVRCAHDATTAVHAAGEFRPQLVVLDTMLPDEPGPTVLRELRRTSPGLPALLLGRGGDLGGYLGGEDGEGGEGGEGGDHTDYLTKPCHLEEVVLRLRTLLRRTRPVATSAGSLLVVGDLAMDEDSRVVTRDGERIDLTATEFELLRYLMRNPRRVLSKAHLLSRVWHQDPGDINGGNGAGNGGSNTNIVELYVSYLRKKIDAGREPMIHTLRGAGYVLKPTR
jgi:two-component system OmpR family response regulator